MLTACETHLQGELGEIAHAQMSQRYDLDLTNATADKGIATQAIAT